MLDTYTFLSQYEDFVFGIIYLILSVCYLHKSKNKGTIVQILLVLVLSTSLNTLFELLILIFPSAIISNNLLNNSQLNLIVYNLNRGRIYYESFSQTLIPILFWFITSTKNLRFKAISTILLIIIFFNTSISNNRSFAFMLIFASILSLLFFIRRKILIIFSVILIIVSTTALSISKNTIGINLIDRIYMNNVRADYETLVFRKDMILEGIRVNQANPIFGVGLGNLNYYFSTNINTNIFMQENVYRRNLPSSSNYIHNLLVTTLAETGILGFLAIILLLLNFLFKDLNNLFKEKSNLKKAVIISFWTLILFSLFNPHMIIRFYVLFWLYRIIIERLRVLESKI